MDLNLTAPINKLGYGVAAGHFLEGLINLGVNVHLQPLGPFEIPTARNEYLTKLSKWFHHDANSLIIYHQNQLARHIGRGMKIGFPFFELNRFTEEELHHLEYQDYIFVSSKWAKQIVQEQFYYNFKYIVDKSIKVVPLGVDTSIFRPMPKEVNSTYRFFNGGKWEIRKGHNILLAAFAAAFDKQDDVELVLLPDNPFLTSAELAVWDKRVKTNKLADKIFIMPRLNSQADVAGLMNACDCGVFPARAEGWNLELMECMAVGLPVITTNYSAHTEYCTTENSFLISVNETELAYDGKWFNAQGEWAALESGQFDQLVDYMRFCYKNRPIGKNNIPAEYDWAVSSKKLYDTLESL